MRMTQLFSPTLREAPQDAEIPSHRLLLRAGMIRKLASGIYSFLPLGWKVVSKVANIVREEMNKAGAQEVFLPALLPKELWEETGRWDVYGKELFRIEDRHEREFCLGPTHEEIITDLVRHFVKSYRQLPLNLYQIQTKFRDEVRPRFGLMRGREFLMKDAYSFHTSEEDLDREYHNMYKTYCNIFDRIGLEYKVVEADTGAIGGGFSQEFMVLAPTGEEEIFYCDKCGYAASRESAGVSKYKIGSPEAKKSQSVKDVSTPNMKTVEEVCKFLKVKPNQLIKTLIYETEVGYFAALVRGDHELNEAKLKKIIGVEDLHLASEKVVEKVTKAPVGFAGPYGLKDIKIVTDNAVTLMNSAVSGANKKDYHLINLCYGRDFKADMIGDIRYALRGDDCPKCKKGKFLITRGIEVGHIFKLGAKYSKKMEALYLSEKNKKEPMMMGCYGIGIGRTAAAAVEQSNDENGIVWPASIAPYAAAIVPVNVSVKEQKEAAESIYDQLKTKFDVILDDREERIGTKLKDIDLIGIPLKIIIGPKGLKDGKAELKNRKTGETKFVALSKIEHEVMKTR